jgi:hypothetical protein
MVLVQACAVSCLTFGSPAAFPDSGSFDLTFSPSSFSSSTSYDTGAVQLLTFLMCEVLGIIDG